MLLYRKNRQGEGVCLAILHPKNDNKITFFKKLICVTTWNIVGTLYW